uniref:Uncharacterized protein n=2 Tax=Lygus hesperus TaxID=30085 RepID=A0A146L6J9_LYGHE
MDSALDSTVIELDSSQNTSTVFDSMSPAHKETTIDPSDIELDSFLSTQEKVELNLSPETTPRRSSRTRKPSTPVRVNHCLSSSPKGTPNSTEVATSPKENQKKKFADGWVFSTPVSTPKKKARTPDSKHNRSPSVTTTPQKSVDGGISDTDSLNGTPSKQDRSIDSLDLETPLNKISSNTVDSLKWSGPSPYKSHRPKYLPKNIKLFKKKFKERQENLESLVKVDERLLQATKTLSKDTPKFDIRMDNNAVSDPMGVVLPMTHVFSPQSYFVMFDELNLDVKVDFFASSDSGFASKSAADIVKGLRNGTLRITSPSEFRFCCYLLTVTANRSVYDSILPLIKRRIGENNYLAWSDLKELLINFGLTLSPNSSTSNTSQTPPQKWNLEFLFLLISNSFTFYKLSLNRRLLSFLADSLFDPILLDLHNTVVLLFRRMAKHLLEKNLIIEDLSFLINRSYLSSIHNRFIFQYLAADPQLVPLAQDLGIRTICDIVNTPYFPYDCSSSEIMSLLNDKFDFIVKLNVKHITQLLLICEQLFLLSGFDPRRVEELASFAKKISTSYSYFDRVNLNSIVNRLEALASCSSLLAQ